MSSGGGGVPWLPMTGRRSFARGAAAAKPGRLAGGRGEGRTEKRRPNRNCKCRGGVPICIGGRKGEETGDAREERNEKRNIGKRKEREEGRETRDTDRDREMREKREQRRDNEVREKREARREKRED